MEGKLFLYPEMFTRDEKIIYTTDALTVTAFKYSTGVEAITIHNDKGYVTMLPFMGQMIWDAAFLEHNLVMRSIHEEPENCLYSYAESYGCFLMHCGLTAMGNPQSEDDHPPHGELPIAKYQEAFLLFGHDEKGEYVSLSGSFSYKRAFEVHYNFMPECRLYADSATLDITATFTNHKDIPLEYYYLCHINYLPVDGSKLYYTAKHQNITVHEEVPARYPEPQKSNTIAYTKKLKENPAIMDTIDSKTQSYAPEIVFTCIYDADKNGEAHTMQEMPDGFACFVTHRPDELPFGIRWIARTDDEDALGMVLPATAEHKGRNYCREKGMDKYLLQGESVSLHIQTGILDPAQTEKFKNHF